LPSPPVQNHEGAFVSEASYMAQRLSWPLTVPNAWIGCDRGEFLWVEIDGERYGLNGMSQSFGYKSFRPFWKDDPGFPASGTGPKVRVQDLFDAAQRECGERK
jgi:hypothetical protein